MTGPPLPTYPHHSHEQCGIQIDLRHTNVWTLKKDGTTLLTKGITTFFLELRKSPSKYTSLYLCSLNKGRNQPLQGFSPAQIPAPLSRAMPNHNNSNPQSCHGRKTLNYGDGPSHEGKFINPKNLYQYIPSLNKITSMYIIHFIHQAGPLGDAIYIFLAHAHLPLKRL